jgi:hypothetical protein
MLNDKWKEQYERMQRSFALLQQIGEQNVDPQDVIPARDVLYHFCCDALHLRDWIASTLGGTDQHVTEALGKQITTEAIHPSPELSACCDIANGFKHLVLHHKSYVTRTNHGHAKVASHDIAIGGIAFRIDIKLHGMLPGEPEPEPPVAQAPVSDEGWVQYTFKIDINGQQYDARDVATKAVAAWDQWLQGSSSIAALLR